jgi:hypothetical protein
VAAPPDNQIVALRSDSGGFLRCSSSPRPGLRLNSAFSQTRIWPWTSHSLGCHAESILSLKIEVLSRVGFEPEA